LGAGLVSELLPCPFCGSDAFVSGDDGMFYATCNECFCCVGEAYDGHAMPKHVFNSAEEAIAAWNIRAAQGSPSPEREALEALQKWFEFQSSENTTALYNAASRFFGSDFDPREYDDVE
jgi:hypothetical protein